MKFINNFRIVPTLLLLTIYLFSFQPGSVQAVVGEVTPGAETNMDKLPILPLLRVT